MPCFRLRQAHRARHVPAVVAVEPNRGLMMPRRKNTRAQDRAKRIEAERKLNDAYVAERNKPPPF